MIFIVHVYIRVGSEQGMGELNLKSFQLIPHRSIRTITRKLFLSVPFSYKYRPIANTCIRNLEVSDLFLKILQMQNLSRESHGKSNHCHGKVIEISFENSVGTLKGGYACESKRNIKKSVSAPPPHPLPQGYVYMSTPTSDVITPRDQTLEDLGDNRGVDRPE